MNSSFSEELEEILMLPETHSSRGLSRPRLLGKQYRDVLSYGKRVSFLYAYDYRPKHLLQNHSKWLKLLAQELSFRPHKF